jgi:hypothetical protein
MIARLAAVLGIAALLAGCGSDPTLPAKTSSATALVDLTVARIAQRRSSSPPAAPAPLTRAFIDAAPKPLRLITIENRNASDSVFLTHRVGDVEVHRTVLGLLMAFRGGVLVATRGFGPDLMSAEVPSAAALRRGSGGHRRIYDYLSGTNATVRVAFDCSLAAAGSETLDLVGLGLATSVVTERCTPTSPVPGFAPEGAIENRYWFDRTGRVRQARQWVSPLVGYIVAADPMR